MPTATVTAALGVLGQALTERPEPDGHVRLFLDEGAPMLDLLRRRRRAADAAARTSRRWCGRWARRLLERADAPADGRRSRSSPWPTR